MISLILPYWDRQAAADRALESLVCEGTDFEVVIVDDGNPVPFRTPDLPLDIRVIRLPKKEQALSPVVAWNEGVKYAKHETIVISCVEVVHKQPVFAHMAHCLKHLGSTAVVFAQAWCPENAEWHCHRFYASAAAPALPEGWGRPFCAMLMKSLYWKAGGFDEEYRQGAGYEDMDFVNRLIRAGAKPYICDELAVIHPKTDAKIKWGGEMFARNKELYERKWPC